MAARRWFMENWPQTVEAQVWEKAWYLENVGHLPVEFPEGSEAYDQWTYTGTHSRKNKETLDATIKRTEVISPDQEQAG